jgi:hypothetical protein
MVRATSNIRLPITTRSAPGRDNKRSRTIAAMFGAGVIHQPEVPGDTFEAAGDITEYIKFSSIIAKQNEETFD